MTNQERHYRRLLALYPSDHRERHGEEMLGVLLASGRPGRRDTADLLWNAFLLHLRRIFVADGDINPRDVLSIVARLGPIALLAGTTVGLHEMGWWVKNDALWAMPWQSQWPSAPVWVVWLAVTVFGLFGWWRTAAVGAWLGTAGFAYLAVFSYRWPPVDPGWVLLGALTAVALTWFPARKLVGGKAVAILTVTVLAAIAIGVLGYDYPSAEWSRLAVLAVGIVAACAPSTRAGRRAALILLVPVMTAVIAQYLLSVRIPASAEATIYYSVPLVVLFALGGLPRRIRRRPAV